MSSAKNILITATATGVGKTTASLMLLQEIKNSIGFKPIETGVKTIPEDANVLYEASNCAEVTLEDICPIAYELAAAPYVCAQHVDWHKILLANQKIAQYAKTIIVESAGGLFTPIEKDVFNIDLFEKLKCYKALLICNSSLGCLSDGVVYSQALKAKNIPFEICVNRRTNDNFEIISKPFWLDYFGECLELKKDIKIIAKRLNE